jgi:hypothetical protein
MESRLMRLICGIDLGEELRRHVVTREWVCGTEPTIEIVGW